MRQLDYIAHHGILGMHWGIRRSPAQLGHPTPTPRKLDKGKTGDYKNDGETVKETYGKGKTRMIQSRNGEHSKNPSAGSSKVAKKSKQNKQASPEEEARKTYLAKKTAKIDRDIHSYDSVRGKGIKTDKGLELLSKDDVEAQVKKLEAKKAQVEAKYGGKWDRKHGRIENSNLAKVADKGKQVKSPNENDPERKAYLAAKTAKVDKDIHSYDAYRGKGIRAKNGLELLSKDDVEAQVKKLEAKKAQIEAKYGGKWDRKHGGIESSNLAKVANKAKEPKQVDETPEETKSNRAKYVKIGVAVGAGALAAYGAYKLHQMGTDEVARRGGDIVGRITGTKDRMINKAKDASVEFQQSMKVAKQKAKLKDVLPERESTVKKAFDKYKDHPEMAGSISQWMTRDDKADMFMGSRGNKLSDLEEYLSRAWPRIVKVS